jgi:predicted MFS family arabinose efflux permease
MTTNRPNYKNALSVFFLSAAACLIYAISSGIRSSYGIMLGAIAENSGVSYSSISFVLAVGQLVYGVMQPLFGIVALKKSNPFVLSCGVLLMVAGLLTIPFCKSLWMLMLSLGIILPSGMGALSFGIIMGAVTPKLSAGSVSTVSGFVNASTGIGSTVLAPAIQFMLAFGGIGGAMLFLSAPTLVLLPVSLWLCSSKIQSVEPASRSGERNIPLRDLFSQALRSPTYRFLAIGFFTCGFHMAIIQTHLFTQITAYGLSEKTAAFAFSIYGIASMAGPVLVGVLCSRVRMQRVLGCLYGSRCFIVLFFLLAPKNLFTVYAVTALLGLTGTSTVVPTAGLVGRTFGAAKLATLYGLVIFIHQIGSFFSAWLGGGCAALTGSYTLIWCISAAFSVVAAVASFCIEGKGEQKTAGA